MLPILEFSLKKKEFESRHHSWNSKIVKSGNKNGDHLSNQFEDCPLFLIQHHSSFHQRDFRSDFKFFPKTLKNVSQNHRKAQFIDVKFDIFTKFQIYVYIIENLFCEMATILNLSMLSQALYQFHMASGDQNVFSFFLDKFESLF